MHNSTEKCQTPAQLHTCHPTTVLREYPAHYALPAGGQSVPGTHRSPAFQEGGLKEVCFRSL